jgi:prolyl-tRNA editing enzyme YbaK/EbsC (Cys-tRNA(Pro) deacylase)
MPSKKRQAKKGDLPPVKLPAALRKFLQTNSAKYFARAHRTVFTAYDMAQTLKIELNQVAKTLILMVDREPVLVVVPANRNLDFGKLKKIISAQRKKIGATVVRSIKLTTEAFISKRTHATPGAVPPFGPFLKLETYADRALLKPKTIVTSGGTFESSLELTPKEFVRLAQPVLGSFGKAR